MKRRTIVIVVVGILLLLGLYGWNQNRVAGTKKSAITVSTVSRETISEVITSSGKTIAKKSVDLKFQTSGLLSWVGVQEGDTVVPGQVLATLDRREVEKNLQKALRDYSNERNDFEETWRVTYNDHPNPELAPTDTIKRILQKNQWDLEKAVLDVELKHLAWEYASLSTPIGGIVTGIDTPIAGINITPASAVFTVIDPTSIVFHANVDETDVGKISIGQAAEITLDAYPDATFSGTVSYISYSSETTSGGATIFPIDITLSGDITPRVGFNGDVAIILSKQDAVLSVPSEAVRETDGKNYVMKKSDKGYEKVWVEIGISSDTETEIRNGLAEGDVVVTKGFSELPK